MLITSPIFPSSSTEDTAPTPAYTVSSHPYSPFMISGATGINSFAINAIFDPTSEVHNGGRLFKNRTLPSDGEDRYLQYLDGKWRVSALSNLGTYNCCAWVEADDASIPIELLKTTWHVNDGGESFEPQDQVKVSAAPKAPQTLEDSAPPPPAPDDVEL